MVLRRLRWIEDRLRWHGVLRRSDLVNRFGISPQQASQDIAIFQELAPGHAVLDASSKTYVRRAAEPSVFPKNPFRWINDEREESNVSVIPMEGVAMPARRADPDIMAALIAAYESKQGLEIAYQSMASAEPTRRVICAHHLVDTGDRYHVRGWDGLRRHFADFVVGRILSVDRRTDYPWVDVVADSLWNETAEVVLAPAIGLSPAQRRAVEQDYGMEKGRVVLCVRKALVTYLAERLGVLTEIQGNVAAGRVRVIRCLNWKDLAPLVPVGV
jgi:hypothetical protein